MTVGLRSCFFKEALCNYDMTVCGLRFVRFDMTQLSALSLGRRNMSEPARFSKEAVCSCDHTSTGRDDDGASEAEDSASERASSSFRRRAFTSSARAAEPCRSGDPAFSGRRPDRRDAPPSLFQFSITLLHLLDGLFSMSKLLWGGLRSMLGRCLPVNLGRP